MTHYCQWFSRKRKAMIGILLDTSCNVLHDILPRCNGNKCVLLFNTSHMTIMFYTTFYKDFKAIQFMWHVQIYIHTHPCLLNIRRCLYIPYEHWEAGFQFLRILYMIHEATSNSTMVKLLTQTKPWLNVNSWQSTQTKPWLNVN